MFRLNPSNKQLVPLPTKNIKDLGFQERFDIQEWIEKSPIILGDELIVISKELILPTGLRLDLLSIDKEGNLVVIEIKRDGTSRDVEWQAIKYASYCSNFLPEEIFEFYAKYLESDDDEEQLIIEEFIDVEVNDINNSQRIILVSQEFHSDVASAVLWLRDHEIDIKCVRLNTYTDEDNNLFIKPDVIIPIPEAKDYIEKKETKQKESKKKLRSSFSLEKGNYSYSELEDKILESLSRETSLTPRLVVFFETILEEERHYDREEIKKRFFDNGIGKDIGQSGRYLSNVSQFLTKKSNSHLRQVVDFESGGELGQIKENYFVIDEYRELLKKLLEFYSHKNSS